MGPFVIYSEMCSNTPNGDLEITSQNLYFSLSLSLSVSLSLKNCFVYIYIVAHALFLLTDNRINFKTFYYHFKDIHACKLQQKINCYYFKTFRTLFYSLYHDYIKMIRIAFRLILCFQQLKINYSQFKKTIIT